MAEMSAEFLEIPPDEILICATVPRHLLEQLKIYTEKSHTGHFGQAIRSLLIMGLEEDRRARREGGQ